MLGTEPYRPDQLGCFIISQQLSIDSAFRRERSDKHDKIGLIIFIWLNQSARVQTASRSNRLRDFRRPYEWNFNRIVSKQRLCPRISETTMRLTDFALRAASIVYEISGLPWRGLMFYWRPALIRHGLDEGKVFLTIRGYSFYERTRLNGTTRNFSPGLPSPAVYASIPPIQ
jgi:hypothetical protein